MNISAIREHVAAAMAVLPYTVSRKCFPSVLRKNNSKLIILYFRAVEIAQSEWILRALEVDTLN